MNEMLKKYENYLEALLFIKGSEGVTIEEISDLFKLTKKQILELLKVYSSSLEGDDSRGIELKKFGDVYKFVTKSNVFDKISKIKINQPTKLNQALLETLAIISYKQPITRIDVEKIRGISSDYVIKKLLLYDLIQEKGRSQLPGSPILYGTTQKFLDKFNISNLNKLPELKEISDNIGETKEIQLFDYD